MRGFEGRADVRRLREPTKYKDMKEILKDLWKWAAIIALITLSYYAMSNTHSSIARDPHNITKITKLELPKIVSVESEDNMERTTSAWNCFIHRTQFAEAISDDCTRELERRCRIDSLHWASYEDGSYTYTDDAWDDGGYYSITCHISKDSSVVTYYVEELEGAFVTLLAFVVLVASGIWGVSLIVSAIRKIRKK